MKKYAFGVDIGGTTVKIGLFETEGILLDTWEIKTRTEDSGKYILGDIQKSIEDKMAENDISLNDIEGIGMGIPGPVSTDGCVLKCANLGWGFVYAADDLSKAMGGIKVKAENDANVAALGEMWKGGGKGHENIVMVTLGTGVGGGVIVNGKILTGRHGAAGEIGHIPMNDNETEVCGCGKRGCLEQYTSASGIARVTRKYLASNPDCGSSMLREEFVTSKVIFDHAKAGDETALKMIDDAAKLLGKAIASICCVVDPEAIVLGGGMSKAGDMLTEAIRKYYKKYAFHAAVETEFCLAELGNLAGIYGGVKMVLD